MPRKSTKKAIKPVRPQLGDGVEILNAGSVLEDPITRTLETNYMPYAMSVIVSRALPEIDGFKPAHRKLLYTMYEMGLLKGARTKSANIVGSTMHLNPHGDAAIYDTMVRMGRGNESLLVPFVDSKGNFGKAYSRDMSCAAARYTEAKLEGVCEELFRDIDKETVDFVPNYDSTTTEPTLLPVTFPTILANNTLGIAVGMACNICSFNLAELCATTVALMKDEKHDISTTMPAPDFVGGGQILYDEAQMREIYENGRGSVKVRARYNVVPGENMIEVTQIPPTTTVEAIMDKIAELVKTGKVKEISDMRDETDLNGLKLTLDLKRGVDADKLMAKLFKATPLEDSFSANFNILVSGQPRVMGVREILKEWTAFRVECVRRRTYYDLHGKEKRLHLLQGLAAILLDIDKAIHIIRTTEEETEVVPNLMIGFGIDEVQADYVAEIKLRHLNREYILKRTGEIEQLEKDIADLNAVLAKPLVVIIGLIVGGLVGALIGFLKYRFNINEVVSSIMLNYTFQYVISFFINTFFVDPVSRQSKEISAASRLTLMDTMVGNLKMDIPLGIILALLTVVAVWFLLEKTKLGYELKAVGYSRSAAKYAGIKVGRSMVLSMMISGALAGLAGVTYYLGYVGSIQPKVLINTGFDAIAVSLLGNNNPFGIVFSTMLITLISKGSTYMKSAAGVDAEIASVITGSSWLFSACNAYIKWKMERGRREKTNKTKEDK